MRKHWALQLNKHHPRLGFNTINASRNLERRKLKSWAEVASRLVAVATGKEAADLVIQECELVNVQTREILSGWQVAVTEGRFAYVGPDASHCIGPATQRVDGGGGT